MNRKEAIERYERLRKLRQEGTFDEADVVDGFVKLYAALDEAMSICDALSKPIWQCGTCGHAFVSESEPTDPCPNCGSFDSALFYRVDDEEMGGRNEHRSRWFLLPFTSGSGKMLYRCGVCARLSHFPDKHCPDNYGCDEYDGDISKHPIGVNLPPEGFK
jgi:rubrerythrin